MNYLFEHSAILFEQKKVCFGVERRGEKESTLRQKTRKGLQLSHFEELGMMAPPVYGIMNVPFKQIDFISV